MEKQPKPPEPEPKPEPPRGWRDVFDEIDYSRYEQQPGENVYVYG